MELLQNPYFLVLAFVFLATLGLCLVMHEYIPAFVFILIPGLNALYDLAKLPQLPMLTGVLFPLFFVAVFLSNLKRGREFPLANFALLFMYILLVIMSSLMSGTDLNLYRAAIALLTLPFIVALCPDNEKTVKYLTIAIALWGVANLFAVMAEWSGLGWKLSTVNANTSRRSMGLMGHSTTMGIYFAVSLSAAHVLVLQAKTKVGRIFWLLFGMGMVVGLIGTLSRGAIAGWLLSFLFIQYKLRGLRVSNMIGIVLAAVIVVGVAASMNLDKLMASRLDTKEVSAQTRIPLLEMGMNLLDTSPIFGVGLNQGGKGHLEAHNTYMQVLMETGVVGFTVFCLVLWRGIRGLRLHIRHNSTNGNSSPYYVGLFGSIIAILFDGTTHVFDYFMPLWLIMGMGFMVVRKR